MNTLYIIAGICLIVIYLIGRKGYKAAKKDKDLSMRDINRKFTRKEKT
jgi:hypothetical protein